VFALAFQAGGIVLFIRWRVGAERRGEFWSAGAVGAPQHTHLRKSSPSSRAYPLIESSITVAPAPHQRKSPAYKRRGF
jgi:hypothetical protein